LKELAEALLCTEEEGKQISLSWFKDILYKLKTGLAQLDNPN